MEKKFIGIGEYEASKSPLIIHTILGSCVAVCLYDDINRIGGMNHILLPGKTKLHEYNSSTRYGINAMELLINSIMKLGGERKLLKAKIFGGAHIIPTISIENSIGRRNSEFVINFLKEERIRLISKDVGGNETRKVMFHTDTGEVFLKRIPNTIAEKYAAKEKQKIKRVERELAKEGDVTLF